MSLSFDSTVKLHTGSSIPRLGFGVYQARGEECEKAVAEALSIGYTHIDDANVYRNEDLVGRAVHNSKITRSSLFLTSKYMPAHDTHPQSTIVAAARNAAQKMDTVSERPHVDLMLVHAPWGGKDGRAAVWKGMVQAKEEGWTKDIGVSNFGVKHLQELPDPKPVINQVELHPWCQQRDIVKYCQEHDIAVEAYSPLVQADKRRLGDTTLTKIAEKHSKEPAQVLIRWSLQKGYIPLPKSVTPSRIKSNSDLYDFELDKSDMDNLNSLDQGGKGAVTWNPVDHP